MSKYITGQPTPFQRKVAASPFGGDIVQEQLRLRVIDTMKIVFRCIEEAKMYATQATELMSKEVVPQDTAWRFSITETRLRSAIDAAAKATGFYNGYLLYMNTGNEGDILGYR